MISSNALILGFFFSTSVWAGFGYKKQSTVRFGNDITVSLQDSYADFNIGVHKWRLGLSDGIKTGEGCQSNDFHICLLWGQNDLSPAILLGRRSSRGLGWTKWRFSLSGKRPRLEVTFNLTSKHLYGGSVVGQWPQQFNNLKMAPFVSGMSSKENGEVGDVIEKIWLMSDGVAIKIPDRSHLFVTQNPQELQLTFMDQKPYKSNDTSIEFEICLADSLRQSFACYPSQRRPIDPKVIKSPIWSTWVRYKSQVDQAKVLNFAAQIESNRLPISVMEIDDNWETCYGNHKWDLKKFPNPKNMISKLHSKGIYVTLWVHPFINTNCSEFNSSVDYLVAGSDGRPSVTSWWNGQAGLIELRTEKGRNWFRSRLVALQRAFNLDGFKFDAGEAKYLPQDVDLDFPDQYTQEYVHFAESFGVLSEVRVGAGSRSAALMERLLDKDSCWSRECSGLGSVIPDVLTLNALGYSAVLPDMVGGNQYGQVLDKELFIRWLQMNTFLPFIQFSVAPWDFDNQTVEISRDLLKLHRGISNLFIGQIQNGTKDEGERIINPVWWLSGDETSLIIDDEFLIGDKILVAPVLDKGGLERDIYFPNGSWFDPTYGKFIQGPTTVGKYPAPLEVVPFFIRNSQTDPVVLNLP